MSFPQLIEKGRLLFQQILQQVIVINLETEQNDLVQKIIDIRKRYRMNLPDAIIAATAIHNNASLITADREFKAIEELSIVSF